MGLPLAKSFICSGQGEAVSKSKVEQVVELVQLFEFFNVFIVEQVIKLVQLFGFFSVFSVY